jgi:hypothetical protein
MEEAQQLSKDARRRLAKVEDLWAQLDSKITAIRVQDQLPSDRILASAGDALVRERQQLASERDRLTRFRLRRNLLA